MANFEIWCQPPSTWQKVVAACSKMTAILTLNLPLLQSSFISREHYLKWSPPESLGIFSFFYTNCFVRRIDIDLRCFHPGPVRHENVKGAGIGELLKSPVWKSFSNHGAAAGAGRPL